MIGFRVFGNDLFVARKQIRFGKSRKKRLRKKQAGKHGNWATVPDWALCRFGDMVVGHPETIRKLMAEIVRQNALPEMFHGREASP